MNNEFPYDKFEIEDEGEIKYQYDRTYGGINFLVKKVVQSGRSFNVVNHYYRVYIASESTVLREAAICHTLSVFNKTFGFGAIMEHTPESVTLHITVILLINLEYLAGIGDNVIANNLRHSNLLRVGNAQIKTQLRHLPFQLQPNPTHDKNPKQPIHCLQNRDLHRPALFRRPDRPLPNPPLLRETHLHGRHQTRIVRPRSHSKLGAGDHKHTGSVDRHDYDGCGYGDDVDRGEGEWACDAGAIAFCVG